MLRRFLPLLIAASSLALDSCGSSVVAPVHAQSSGVPGTVTVTWVAPTQGTDGLAISGSLTYIVDEMQPCTSTACASDSTILGTVASGITGNSAQITNVADGTHCYAVQAVELAPSGATTASALSVITSSACANVSGSSTPQQTPNPPSGVQATPT